LSWFNVVVDVVVVRISETTTREVIRMLLAKFHIQDNPRKFALYEQSAGEYQLWIITLLSALL